MGIFDQGDGGREGGGPSGPSFISRWIGPIMIAVIGLFMYMTHTQTNPVTGAKQHLSISPIQEIRLGLQSAPEMAKKMGGELLTNDPRSEEVKKMGAQLVSSTIANKSPWKYQFHLLADTKTINAFALPGGQIFITLGLYNKLENQAELAGVLSHEMGHVIERHTAQQMAKSELGQILVTAVGVAGSDPQHHTQGYTPMMIAGVVNHMFQLKYSRKDESEADLWGIKLMEQAGYDPHAMIKVLEILKTSGGHGHTPEMFQTHPDPDNRIKQIQAYLEKNPPPANLKQGGSLKEVKQ